MVNFWIFPSISISSTIKNGIISKWYLSRQTVERYDITIKKGDKALIYQPGVIDEEAQKAGYNYIGSFTIDSEPFIEKRKEEYYAMGIKDFQLWRIFVAKSEEENRDSNMPKGSEFGRLITTQVIIPIDKEDYELVADLYGKQLEQKIKPS